MKTNKKIDSIEQSQFSPFDAILAEARYILLYGEINEESAKDVNTKLIAMNIKNKHKPIILEINSCGGNVSDGISIMNTIQIVPSYIITLINGEAASMAGLISIVADRRFITPNSYWLGHPMFDMVAGSPQTIEDRGKYLQQLEEDLRKIFKNKTKLNDKDFQKMLKGELWLNSYECLEKGIVDKIQPFLAARPKKQKKNKKI